MIDRIGPKVAHRNRGGLTQNCYRLHDQRRCCERDRRHLGRELVWESTRANRL